MPRLRVLFLSSWFPYPATNGSELRIYNLLRSLAAVHDITLLSFSDKTNVDRGCEEMRSICRSVEVVARRPFNPTSPRAQLGFLSSKPRSIVDTHSTEMVSVLVDHLRETRHDVIVASQLGAAAYAPYFGTTPALFDEVELGVLYDPLRKAGSFAERLRHRLTWMKQCRYLTRLLPHFRACTVVSLPERELVKLAAPAYGPVEVVPNFVSLRDYEAVRPSPQRTHIVFPGSLSFHANLDAMEWFLAEIYPLVRARIPDVCLTITGDSMAQELPVAENVQRTGLVDDVRPYVASSWLSVVPVRVGGGTRIKILESMALGTPVVSTSKGAEGLAVRVDEHLLLADDAPSFADAVVRLLSDAALRERLSRNGRRLVEEQYEAERIGPRFEALVERVAGAAG